MIKKQIQSLERQVDEVRKDGSKTREEKVPLIQLYDRRMKELMMEVQRRAGSIAEAQNLEALATDLIAARSSGVKVELSDHPSLQSQSPLAEPVVEVYRHPAKDLATIGANAAARAKAEAEEEAETGQKRRRKQGRTSVAELLKRRQFTLARFAKTLPSLTPPL